MKKVLLCLSILSIFISCSKKDELIVDSMTETENQKVMQSDDNVENKPQIIVDKNDIVRIMVRGDGAPGMFLGDDGEVHGFYVELEKMIMKEMGQKYIFEAYTDVGPVVQALKTGTAHIALSVPDLPDYRSIVYLSIPYEILNYVTFIKDENIDIKGATKDEIIKSLSGKRVGVQTQGHIWQILREYKDIELIDYPTTTKAMEALNMGYVDAVPENRETGNYYLERNSWNVKHIGETILSYTITTGISRRFDPSFLERYNMALQFLIDSGEVEALWESYYGPMGEEDKPWIKH